MALTSRLGWFTVTKRFGWGCKPCPAKSEVLLREFLAKQSLAIWRYQVELGNEKNSPDWSHLEFQS